MEEILSDRSMSLMLQMAHNQPRESDIHRAWWRDRQVDGVVLVDIVEDDQRIEVLQTLDVPTVVIGPPSVAGGFTCLWTDEYAAMDSALRYLYTLGSPASPDHPALSTSHRAPRQCFPSLQV